MGGRRRLRQRQLSDPDGVGWNHVLGACKGGIVSTGICPPKELVERTVERQQSRVVDSAIKNQYIRVN
jgi:hypothetical protein